MVYGKILFNNIKEYTPKWYPTVPYSQTVKPTFGTPTLNSVRKPQNVWHINTLDSTKRMWRNFAFVFQRHSFMWQVLLFSIAFVGFYMVREPILAIYKANNRHRTYNAAMAKEKAHKKKLRELEEAE